MPIQRVKVTPEEKQGESGERLTSDPWRGREAVSPQLPCRRTGRIQKERHMSLSLGVAKGAYRGVRPFRTTIAFATQDDYHPVKS